MGYAKLFSSITESSLWSEPKEVRLLFVTMLARSDASGFVEASLPGLARVSNLTMDETVNALKALESPDSESKNPSNEGRRIHKVPGGWFIFNYEDYRNRRGEEERREWMREYMREYRRKHSVNLVSHSKPPLAKAEAEAEAEADNKPPISPKGDLEWANEIYSEYPKKVGKPIALKSIRAEMKSKPPEELLKLTRAYATAVAGTETLIPNPSTWFNQQRFNDDPSTWARKNGYKTVPNNRNIGVTNDLSRQSADIVAAVAAQAKSRAIEKEKNK